MSFMFHRGAGASQEIPQTRQRPVSGSGNNTWLEGAPLVLSSGALVEVGADPAAIGGIAVHDVRSGSGSLYPLARTEFPPGYALAHQIEDFHVWHASYVGTLPSTVGGAYGITKNGTTGRWQVDFAKTGGTVTRVTLVDLGPTTVPSGSSAVTPLIARVGVIFTPTASFTISRI